MSDHTPARQLILLNQLLILLLVFSLFTACKTTKPVSGTAQVKAGNFDDSLDLKIGQMIMMGIDARTSISTGDILIQEIKSGKLGGIIVFEKNIAKVDGPQQLKLLTTTLQKAASIPLLISIDEEGGKVHRMKKKYGFVDMPSAGYLGTLDNIDSTYFYNQRLAATMAQAGINLNFAPSVDVALNPDNPIIAKVQRSFSDDPVKVAKHAAASIRAQHSQGVKTILKHFPGHGSSAADTHLGIAEVTDQWKFMELIPYRALIDSGLCDAVMTAHIVNCHLDTACLPGTLSSQIVNGILRGFMGYKGVVFSDDMQMNAISKEYGFETAIKMAVLAGVDVVLFGNNVNLKDTTTATRIHSIIKNFVLTEDIPRMVIDNAYQRIYRLKMKKVKG